jgi:hypothetical protein
MAQENRHLSGSAIFSRPRTSARSSSESATSPRPSPPTTRTSREQVTSRSPTSRRPQSTASAPSGRLSAATCWKSTSTARARRRRTCPSYFVGFPLRKFQFPIGWTMQWEKNAMARTTPSRMPPRRALIFGACGTRSRRRSSPRRTTPSATICRQRVALREGVHQRRLDGHRERPEREVFDGTTHTHYDGSATLTAAAITAQIATCSSTGTAPRSASTSRSPTSPRSRP